MNMSRRGPAPPFPPRQHLRGTYMNHDLGGAERSPSHTRDFKYTPAYIDMNKIRHFFRINSVHKHACERNRTTDFIDKHSDTHNHRLWIRRSLRDPEDNWVLIIHLTPARREKTIDTKRDIQRRQSSLMNLTPLLHSQMGVKGNLRN